jgi:hypothetical protein
MPHARDVGRDLDPVGQPEEPGCRCDISAFPDRPGRVDLPWAKILHFELSATLRVYGIPYAYVKTAMGVSRGWMGGSSHSGSAVNVGVVSAQSPSPGVKSGPDGPLHGTILRFNLLIVWMIGRSALACWHSSARRRNPIQGYRRRWRSLQGRSVPNVPTAERGRSLTNMSSLSPWRGRTGAGSTLVTSRLLIRLRRSLGLICAGKKFGGSSRPWNLSRLRNR